MHSDFTIKSEVFEGPFSTLVELIEKHKLSINEVSLSKITDEYIAYVKSLEDYKLDEISSFIVIAATLMLIKSKTLIPLLSITEEEKGEIKVLEKRIEVFQVVRAIADYVRKEYSAKVLYKRPFVRVKRKVFSPGSLVTQENMFKEVMHALTTVPVEPKVPETKVRQVIRIEEVLTRLLDRVRSSASISFQEFSKNGIEGNAREIKTFVVVSFLAMLELIKNGTLDATQDDVYSDITITT